MREPRIILGIDPGTNLMGWAVLSVEKKIVKPLEIGVLELNKIKDPYLKLQRIFEEVCGLVANYQPQELAIEAPFYGKNVQSMLKLGRAQGVAIAAALVHKMAVYEYAPRKVKLAITGRGAASKEQVATMLHKTLVMTNVPVKWDATDALAVAVCHYYQTQFPMQENPLSCKSWESFLAQHPERRG
ncbi:MAG: crossover junction endodeoxyribonuclease RuvC [Bacteroidetes bacterium]|nr:crossover junction endodeoxyribonuclease RuvC [Bacteroidota bacterium]